MATLLSLRILCLVVLVVAEPAPGRLPKVYNALITSNQNLEPSKAYPIYQPVLHETYSFPFQPAVFYGDFALANGIHRVPALPPKELPAEPQPSEPKPEEPIEKPSSSEVPPPPEPAVRSQEKPIAPPQPPTTKSPIPLNEYGLPPYVLPLGRLDPTYEGFTHIGPFTYSYPSFRFYDPFDPFSLSPYTSFPTLYRPITNVLGQNAPVPEAKEAVPSAAPLPPAEQTTPQGPPPEPSDLNILNFSSKDPAIPNVPPPPLPQGGLKPDNSE